MPPQTLTIVGVGLIGASIGLAAKNRRLFRSVRGVGRNRETLQRARDRGAIDELSLDLRPLLADSDVIVFCTPVDRIAEQVLEAAPLCPATTLLTDAGSAKARIVSAVENRLPSGASFVGSHPLAGSEKRGPDHADANLFAGRWTVVTPTPRTPAAALERTTAFWHGLGSRVKVMTPEEHDRALAFTSHLPHLLASALAGLLPPELHDLAATGFRDTTRIAAGDSGLWTAIFEHNSAALGLSLRALEDRLGEFRRALEAGDWNTIDHLLTQAKKVRDALGS
ncbi:MAG: prephenate dehydrogenase [Gemmataceae bacterium]